MIEFITTYWFTIFVVLFLVFILIVDMKRTAALRKLAYQAKRKEDVSRISDGVANGILAVFTNEEFLQALRDGAYVKIDINVDGSQNIVIAGSQNQILEV